jgi:hypothetical protein
MRYIHAVLLPHVARLLDSTYRPAATPQDPFLRFICEPLPPTLSTLSTSTITHHNIVRVHTSFQPVYPNLTA